MDFDSGIYFFHSSFLKDVSDNWLSTGSIGPSANLFMNLVSQSVDGLTLRSCDRAIKELFTDDRSMENATSAGFSNEFVPGFVDLITEQMLPNNNDLDDDEYSLKVAAFKRISTSQTFFLVSKEEQVKITTLAQRKGYTLRIMSADDFRID